MDTQRRILFAFLICIGIWLVFQQFAPPPPPPESQDAAVTAEDETKKTKKEQDEPASDRESSPATPGAPRQEGTVKGEKLALELVNVEDDGVLRRARLLDRQFQDDAGEALDILGLGDATTFAITFARDDTDFKTPPHDGWEVVESGPAAWEVRHVSDEVEVISRLTLGEGYEGLWKVKVINRSVTRQRHRLAVQSRFGGASLEDRYDIHRGLCAQAEEVSDFDAEDVKEDRPQVNGDIQWLALDGKYFASILVPREPAQSCSLEIDADDANLMVGGLGFRKIELEPGESQSYEFGLYLGTKEIERLEGYAEVSGRGLERAVDWGFMGGLNSFIGRPLLSLLRWFYGLTGIWGVAIILLTVVVRLLVLPLTLKQMASARKMREIQPEVKRLQEKYKEDKVRMTQEMQALWKREGVNPLAGCLPLLIQMPIWFALYSMLGTVVELYREPFLWLPDLSAKDPLYVLPIALGGLMVLQFKVQPTPMDNQQAKMMAYLMPGVFTVMMLFLPSGLGVYIFASVLLSLVQTLIQVRPWSKTEKENKSEGASTKKNEKR